jgi:hypothetical protein
MSQSNVTNDVTRRFVQLFSAQIGKTKFDSKFNSLKRDALQVFARHGGWLDVPTWSVRAGFYPVRAAYTYLRRLYGYGLLHRGRDARGRLVYRLSRRGVSRLRWLCRREGGWSAEYVRNESRR